MGINNNVPTGDWVRDPNRMFQDMPRYLYVLKTKKDAAILNNSQNDSVADYFFVRFVNWYSNHFQKNSIMTVFDPKKKIDLKLSNIQNVKDYFEKNKGNYNDDYIKYVLNYCNKITFGNNNGFNPSSNVSQFVNFYNFIGAITDIIKKESHDNIIFIRMNVMFNAVGVDGFTQRKSDGLFIHKPEYQTLLLNSHCVEDINIIDRKFGAEQEYVASMSDDEKETVKGDMMSRRKKSVQPPTPTPKYGAPGL